MLAPRSGAVLDVNAAAGELSKSTDNANAIATIADLSRVWVVGDVYEKDLGALKQGEPVQITLPAYPGQSRTGKLAVISDALDPQTRTLKSAWCSTIPGELKPEMFASIRVQRPAHDAVVIPASAVLHEGGDTSVMVQTKPDTYERRLVSIASITADNAVVTSGLKPGEIVVSEGAALVRGGRRGVMRKFVLSLLRFRTLVLLALAVWLVVGMVMFLRLDIEAYPDPSPPLVEIITQNSAWSAEEMEQQVTVPIETTLNGVPHLQYIRSISIFGLSDVKMYFDFDSEYIQDRQEVLNRLEGVTLPNNLQPQLSPWSPTGEIYRFQLTGQGYSLNELKATADWLVRREIKQVSGIIDITTFGGTTRQYQAEIDPNRLLQYNLNLPQVVTAVTSSNANAGGSYISLGGQSVNVRGLGLLRDIPEMQHVLVAEKNGAPVYLGDVATVHEGFQPRLGKVGIDHQSGHRGRHCFAAEGRAIVAGSCALTSQGSGAKQQTVACGHEDAHALRPHRSHWRNHGNRSPPGVGGCGTCSASVDRIPGRLAHVSDCRT